MFIHKYTMESLGVYLEEGGIPIKISMEEKTRKTSRVCICLRCKINKKELLFQHHKYELSEKLDIMVQGEYLCKTCPHPIKGGTFFFALK